MKGPRHVTLDPPRRAKAPALLPDWVVLLATLICIITAAAAITWFVWGELENFLAASRPFYAPGRLQ